MESIVPNPRIAHVQENAITAEIISDGLIKEDLMDELELTEIECDAVLLDDDAWNAKYTLPETAPEPAPEEPADPYEGAG